MRAIIALLLVAPVLAGCVNAPEDVQSASASDPLVAGGAATSTPYAYDGNIGPALVVCPMVTCGGADPSSSRWTKLEYDGTLTGLALTMTWDATAPNMETLRMGISWGDEADGKFEMVEGTSPLVLELSDLNFTADDDVHLWAWIVTPVPMGLAHASAPQEYHVEGTLTTGAGA